MVKDKSFGLNIRYSVPTVLVTGASGYIATHIVQQLQQSGLYKVRGTVRSTKNEEKIAPLKNLCPGAKYPLELVEADLSDASTWLDAVKGCTYVLHTASPFPSENPKHEDEVIKPAVDGTLFVLRACRAAECVKRVVLTSSGAAMEWTPDKGRVFTEADWSDLNARGISPYYRSKTLAEKAAWNFVKELPAAEKIELAVMNPTFVIGPVLSGGISTSQVVPKRLLERQLPALPALGFNVVDVRDVARAHINGMTVPEAAGNRHILAIRHAWFSDMAKALDEEFKPQGYNIPTSTAPNALVRFVGLFDSTIKMITPLLGKEVVLYSDRMTKVLGITPISMKQSLVDMAYSMIEAGKIKKTSRYRGPPVPPAQNTRM